MKTKTIMALSQLLVAVALLCGCDTEDKAGSDTNPCEGLTDATIPDACVTWLRSECEAAPLDDCDGRVLVASPA